MVGSGERLAFRFAAHLLPHAANAEGWRSPLAGRRLVLIDKVPQGGATAGELPPAVQGLLGPDAVEYESFVATRIPAEAVAHLEARAHAQGRFTFAESSRPVVLPFQTFAPDAPETRSTPWRGHRLQPVPVPGLYWIHFAFPILEDWTAALRDCGAEPLLYYGDGVFLTRARNLGVIQSCHSAARRLSWVEPFLTTDRIAPAVLDAADLEMRPYSLVFAPGTTREAALAELPAAVEPGGDMTWQDGSFSLGVLAGAPELEALLRTSRLLLGIHPAESEPKPSDEFHPGRYLRDRHGSSDPGLGSERGTRFPEFFRLCVQHGLSHSPRRSPGALV